MGGVVTWLLRERVFHRNRHLQLLRALDSIPDAVYLKDSYGIVSCNTRFYNLMGLQVGQADMDEVSNLAAKLFPQISHQDDLVFEGRSLNMSLWITNPDGSRSPYDLVRLPMDFPNNRQKSGLVGMLRNTQEQHDRLSAIYKRDNLLRKLNIINEKMLSQSRPFMNALMESFQILAESIGADRIRLYRATKEAGVYNAMGQWARTGWETPSQDLFFAHKQTFLYSRIQQNMFLFHHTQELPEPDRSYYAQQKVKTVLLLPCPLDADNTGIFCIEHCSTEYPWSPGEIWVMQSISANLSLIVRQLTQSRSTQAKREQLISQYLKNHQMAYWEVQLVDDKVSILANPPWMKDLAPATACSLNQLYTIFPHDAQAMIDAIMGLKVEENTSLELFATTASGLAVECQVLLYHEEWIGTPHAVLMFAPVSSQQANVDKGIGYWQAFQQPPPPVCFVQIQTNPDPSEKPNRPNFLQIVGPEYISTVTQLCAQDSDKVPKVALIALQVQNQKYWYHIHILPQGSMQPAATINALLVNAQEQHSLQEQLQTQTDHFALALEASSSISWEMNASNMRRIWKGNIERLLGYNDEDLGGSFTKFLRLVHPEDRRHIEPELISCLAGKKDMYIEFRFMCADGSYRWFLDQGRATLDSKGNATVIRGILSDISKQRELLGQLYMEQHGAQLALKAAHAVSWKMDSQSGAFYFGPEVQELLGYTPEELKTRQDLLNYVHSDDRHKIPAPESISNTFTNTVSAEFRIECADHQEKWIYIVGAPYKDMSASQTSIHGLLMDISTRKENEEAMRRQTRELERARQQAEEANRSKSEFLSNISHEIRTPMNSIIGFTDILLRKITDEGIRQNLETISKSGKTLLELINEILDFSKIEAGKMELQIEAVEIRPLVQQLYSIFKPNAEAKGIQLELHLHPELPTYLLLDELRLRQVITNLLSNAIKFTSKGYVKVSVESVANIIDPGNYELRIIIRDTGMGIPYEEQQRIFESFRQQTGQDAGKYGGTGLGLAISRNLVRLMGGNILVDSTQGVGSEFTIILSKVAIPSLKTTAKKNHKEGQKNSLEQADYAKSLLFETATILVVDDVVDNQVLMQNILQDFNFKVILAENGIEAIEANQRFEPDLIFMDLRMPKMNGIKALEEIKHQPVTKMPKIVALTASVLGDDRTTRIKEHGFDGYLPKPIEFTALLNILTSFIPYTQKDFNKTNTEATSLAIQKIDLPREIAKILQDDFVPRWEELKQGIVFDSVLQFANDLQRVLYQKPGVEDLVSWANKLEASAKNFDFKGLSQLLEQFIGFVDLYNEE
jgi:PAS domain S-box-containing protein